RTGASVWQQAAAAGVEIEPDDHDVHDEDLALGLQNCLTRDGQNSPSANIPMAGFRLTGLGAATTNGHAIVYGQQNVQLGSGVQVGANFQAGAGAQLTDNLTINGQANPVSVEYFRDGTNETLANVVAAGDDDAGNKTTYVEVVYGAHDRTNGQEAGKVQVSLANGAGGKAIYSRFLPDIFQVFGYDAGSGNGPAIEIRRESASPADNDGLGWLRFYGRNDAAEDLQYASIFAKATDVSDGTEDGELGWNVTRAGSSGVRMRLGGGLVVGSGDPPSTDGVINAEGGYQLGGAALVMGEVLAEATLSNDTDFTVTWDNANDYWKI